jgi:hypothetical protein
MQVAESSKRTFHWSDWRHAWSTFGVEAFSDNGRHQAAGATEGTVMAPRKADRSAERGERRAETNAVTAYLTALRAPKVPARSRAKLEKAACPDRAVDRRGVVTDP